MVLMKRTEIFAFRESRVPLRSLKMLTSCGFALGLFFSPQSVDTRHQLRAKKRALFSSRCPTLNILKKVRSRAVRMAGLGFLNSIVGVLRSNWRPQIEIKRFRYWKEMREKGYMRRFGWKDTLPRGLLPRIANKPLRTLPIYRANNAFSTKKATLGQNDYIDILGDGKLHPARIVSNVPTWLKTFRGNEFQRLIRKEKMFDRGIYPQTRPTKWSKMKTRMDWLWYELNYRRKFY